MVGILLEMFTISGSLSLLARAPLCNGKWQLIWRTKISPKVENLFW
jgi:hypothetical protein